jgi:uncharacterized protein
MISALAVLNSIRRPESALRWIAMANTLFFASFLLVLAFASQKAHAEEIVCKGSNLVAELAENDPAAFKALEAEAAKTVNGDKRLWKIEKEGLKPSYLFGTMHMTDPRVIDLTPEARTAFDTSDTVVIESTEILDPAIAARALLSRPDLTMFTDATTLSSTLNEADKKTLETGLKARGIPLVTVNKMKPWMIAGLVALPECELKRKQGGAPFLDIKLAQDAKAAGKSVEGLETIVEQLDAISSLPMEFHLKGLVEALALGDKMDDVLETMIALYVEGRTDMIMPFLKSVSPANSGDAESYGDFEERVITARNVIMATRGEQFLARGNTFIAVGALHLPGEKGLVELLRKDGYTVTALAK